MYNTYDVTWGAWFIVDIYRTDRPIGDGVPCCESPTDQLACICGVCNPSIVEYEYFFGEDAVVFRYKEKLIIAKNHVDFDFFWLWDMCIRY